MEALSFAPIAKTNSKILILGSMPSVESLKQQQYYAYKYNAFWPILFKIFEEEYSDNYYIKKELILRNKIALWDVLGYCIRKGSSDSAIKEENPNDIPDFLIKHKDVKTIFFNGKAAEKYFSKYFKHIKQNKLISLPSTSPANARLSFDEKYRKWQIIEEYLD